MSTWGLRKRVFQMFLRVSGAARRRFSSNFRLFFDRFGDRRAQTSNLAKHANPQWYRRKLRFGPLPRTRLGRQVGHLGRQIGRLRVPTRPSWAPTWSSWAPKWQILAPKMALGEPFWRLLARLGALLARRPKKTENRPPT